MGILSSWWKISFGSTTVVVNGQKIGSSSSSSIVKSVAVATTDCEASTAKSLNQVMIFGLKATMGSKLLGDGGSSSPRRYYKSLADLPVVPVDKIVRYLADNDLRSFHQVCRSWKGLLESRWNDEKRRQELVKKMQDNKENIRNGAVTPQEAVPAAMAQRSARRERASIDFDGKKPGNNLCILMECTNQVDDGNTPTSVNNTTSTVATPDANNYQTPTFKFQEFQKAEKSLDQGQKLLRCGKCHGPVPSPATPGVHSKEFQESRRLSTQSNSTRCKLTSRLDANDQFRSPPQLESPQRQKCKKARTASSVDLSPIPYFSPVTSLEEKMSTSLFVSSPCLTTPARITGSIILPLASSLTTGLNTIPRSTSCSSITGIDFPHHSLGSPIEPSFNTSSLYGYSSFSAPPLHNQLGTSSLDLNGNSLNCSRSCCSPRRVNHNNSQLLHTSHYSDSGLSWDGDSIDEFHNMIPSPATPPVYSILDNNTSIKSSHRSTEHHRDYFTGNHSDGALSVISCSNLQRSASPSTESVFSSVVLECPNPKCSFRFCSNCEESEHPGRPCHLLSSDHLESLYFEHSGNNSNNNHISSFRSAMDFSNGSLGGSYNISSSTKSIRDTNSNSNKSGISKKGNTSSSSSRSGKHKNQKKITLRRLARL